MSKLSYEYLHQLYVEEQLLMSEIAEITGVPKSTIAYNLNKYSINKETQLRKFILNDLQYDFSVGSILGDGSLYNEKDGNYKFEFSHAENQKEYLEFKLKIMSEFCKTAKLKLNSNNKNRNSNSQLMYRFTTRALPCFTDLSSLSISDLLNELNYNSFVIWLMDDGHLSHRVNVQTYTLSIARFTKEEALLVKGILKEKFNLDCSIDMYNEGLKKTIRFNSTETNKIKDIILNCDFSDDILNTMNYKIPHEVL